MAMKLIPLALLFISTVFVCLAIYTVNKIHAHLHHELGFATVWVFLSCLFCILTCFHALCVTVFMTGGVLRCACLYFFSCALSNWVFSWLRFVVLGLLLMASHIAALFWCVSTLLLYGCGASPETLNVWFPGFLHDQFNIRIDPSAHICDTTTRLVQDVSVELPLVCFSIAIFCTAIASHSAMCLVITEATILLKANSSPNLRRAAFRNRRHCSTGTTSTTSSMHTTGEGDAATSAPSPTLAPTSTPQAVDQDNPTSTSSHDFLRSRSSNFTAGPKRPQKNLAAVGPVDSQQELGFPRCTDYHYDDNDADVDIVVHHRHHQHHQHHHDNHMVVHGGSVGGPFAVSCSQTSLGSAITPPEDPPAPLDPTLSQTTRFRSRESMIDSQDNMSGFYLPVERRRGSRVSSGGFDYTRKYSRSTSFDCSRSRSSYEEGL